MKSAKTCLPSPRFDERARAASPKPDPGSPPHAASRAPARASSAVRRGFSEQDAYLEDASRAPRGLGLGLARTPKPALDRAFSDQSWDEPVLDRGLVGEVIHRVGVRVHALTSLWKDSVVAFGFGWVPFIGPPVSAMLLSFSAAKTAWHLLSGTEVAPRSWSERVGHFAREMGAFAAMGMAMLPELGRAIPKAMEGRLPVVAVHGICGHPTNMRAICRAAEERGHPVWAAPIGSFPLRQLDRYVDNLERFMGDVLARHPGQSIHFVAHSMGGIVVAKLFERRPDIGALAATVDTLASPHRGTPVAHVVPGPEAIALRTGTPQVRELPKLRDVAPNARIRTFSADQDVVVFPRNTSRTSGARHVTVPHHGHVSILVSPQVIDKVLDGFEEVEARVA